MAETNRLQLGKQIPKYVSVEIRKLKTLSNERYVSKADFIRLVLRATTLAPAQIRDLLGRHQIEVTTKNVRDVKRRLPLFQAGQLKRITPMPYEQMFMEPMSSD